jgi:hypothetical protein
MAMYTQEDSKKGNQFLFDFKQEGQEISKVYVYPLRKGSGYPKVNKASGVWEEFMEKVKEGQKEAVLTVN